MRSHVHDGWTLADFAGEDTFDSRDADSAIASFEDIEDEPDFDGADDLEALRTFREDAGNSEWPYGQFFIADSYFEEYAREVAEDIGAIPDDAGWPATCIDWEQAANELRQDYYLVDVAGVEYWTR
jgi:hypothetical protein